MIQRGICRCKGGKQPMKHEHEHQHEHGHEHHHNHTKGRVLTVRANSGLSGDMLMTGLLKMITSEDSLLDNILSAVMPELQGTVKIIKKQVNGIYGWHAEVNLPHQHEHRTLSDIMAIINASAMSDKGRALAIETFTLLAKAEGCVHGKSADEIHFHEVGALDSILDICVVCELFADISPDRFVVSPLPIADGSVHCAHGIIPVPAPAVLEMLEGIPVRSFKGCGETVTPTAISLLKSLKAEFGLWPDMTVDKKALVYGTKIFENAPNGAIFASGKCL